MPTETAARTEPVSSAMDERAYLAFCEAISSSTRGRAFLAEYARRNRSADTERLLAAIERLQSLVTTPALPQTSEAIKQDLRALLDEIVTAQCELEARILATKAAKLAELMALVERRISNMLEAPRVEVTLEVPRVEVTPPAETPTPLAAPPPEPLNEPERTHLAVVPLPEQPELPIPSPASTQPPSISLVRSEAIIAEVAFVEPPPAPPQPAPDMVDTRPPEPQFLPQSLPATAETKPLAEAAPPPDPLASIKALSEEERLALFT
jgi:hypothetical protein